MDRALDEIGYWLALYTIPQCGIHTALLLLKKFKTPKEILSASYDELIQAGIRPTLASHLKNPDWERVELGLHWLEQPQNSIFHWGHDAYPSLLNEIADPPLILFMKGEVSILQRQMLAIVGARSPTPTGREIAYQLANELTEQGFVIISGLAKGIDGAAHQGALFDKAATIAVLGSGIECIYPSCHRALANEIVEKGGLLISEFFPNTSPKANYFPRRNRIISGLSLGVIVVEASLRSGSLITARYALNQGREVFAIPGSIRSLLSQGCHALLKDGATLVENCEDIIQSLSFLPQCVLSSDKDNVGVKRGHNKIPRSPLTPQKNQRSSLDSQDKKLVECLGFETTSIDSVLARTKLPITTVLDRLSILQLQGYIDKVPGGYVRK
ncbi:DNA-processing protein DprA [Rickettsiella grylli]|uniref:DNA-processing protein DprA n=1 Tax=Rickettsiella grylli TaxID=59196 RepID=UPI0009F80C45|nr:DNA-processing protein DprA [Rickettsiella grylli]